jgi:uncharacterized protein with GYD domain
MLFITLYKLKVKPTRETMENTEKAFAEMTKEGVEVKAWYWTLGRYDGVVVVEGPDEKTAMKNLIQFADNISTETLIALTTDEVSQFIQ